MEQMGMAATVIARCQEMVFLLLLITTSLRSEDNIAFDMTATQSSNLDDTAHLAGNAVNGCKGPFMVGTHCCIHTAAGEATVWWRVDLCQLSTIKNISMFYRDNWKSRFGGYHLYLSNTTTTPQDGILCYVDNSSTPRQLQLNVTHQCRYVARYVTIYNYRNNPKRYDWYFDNAFLELCEVEVFGCHAGWYGDGNCENTCPGQCKGGNCDSNTGFCFYCISGKHGDLCDNNCSTNCRDNICDKDTAKCSECEAGFYGNKCDSQCDTSCKTNICYQNSGECIAGAPLSVTCGPGAYPTVCDYPTTTSCTGGTIPRIMVCRCNQGYFDSNGYSTAGGICTPMSNLKVMEVKSSGAVGSSSVTITWTPPPDSSQISSYSVVWRVSGSADVAGSSYPVKSESATITGLTPDTSYVFTVKSTETGSRPTTQEVESDSDVIIKYDTSTGTSNTPWIAACAVTAGLAVLLAISSAFFWNRSRKSTGNHREETIYDTPERVYANTDMHIYALTHEDSQQAARTGTGDDDYNTIDVYDTAS